MTRATLALCLLLGLLAAPQAHGFSDAEAFGRPVEEGGGGGRWFTGSAADGYTCKVCHRGGQSPNLDIRGLPIEGYVPGTAYEITILWPGDAQSVALTTEVTDGVGMRAGTLRLPPQQELRDPELCQPVGAGLGAGELIDLPTRSVISMADCGAHRLRFLWTAPTRDEGPVWFSGSLVNSNAKGDVEGDGVRDFAHVVGSPSSQDALASKIASGVASGCSALPRRAGGGAWCVCPIGLMVLAVRRRRVGRR
jgi:hypothetical protein